MSDFREIVKVYAIFGSLKKISNSYDTNRLCDYHFEAHDLEITNILWNLFCEIFKFHDFKKAFIYFAKQTIYSDSPDHMLQNAMQHV